jgi:hypothetical protein
MLKIPHCLDNRLTDSGKVASLTHRPRSTPQKHDFSLLVLISVISRVNPKILKFMSHVSQINPYFLIISRPYGTKRRNGLKQFIALPQKQTGTDRWEGGTHLRSGTVELRVGVVTGIRSLICCWISRSPFVASSPYNTRHRFGNNGTDDAQNFKQHPWLLIRVFLDHFFSLTARVCHRLVCPLTNIPLFAGVRCDDVVRTRTYAQ